MIFRKRPTRPPKEVERLEIEGKRVYLFENHAAALASWAAERRRLAAEPLLITLDTHTDTNPAFTHAIYYEAGTRQLPGDLHEKSTELCRAVDFADETSIEKAVEDLSNDEQIDCAIKIGVLKAAFVISYRATVPTEPRDGGNDRLYDVPENRIFILPASEGFTPDASLSLDDDFRRHCDLAIEKHYLDRKLEIAGWMAESLGVTDLLEEPFILDIDLDYFQTDRSIDPANAATFHELIRRAAAITIAMETNYVEMEKLPGETVTSEILFDKIKSHIRAAMSA